MDLILQMKESCGMCIHPNAYTKAVETVAGSHFAALRQGAHATAHQYVVDSMQKFCRAVSVRDQAPGLGGQSEMWMLLKGHPGLREQFTQWKLDCIVEKIVAVVCTDIPVKVDSWPRLFVAALVDGLAGAGL